MSYYTNMVTTPAWHKRIFMSYIENTAIQNTTCYVVYNAQYFERYIATHNLNLYTLCKTQINKRNIPYIAYAPRTHVQRNTRNMCR